MPDTTSPMTPNKSDSGELDKLLEEYVICYLQVENAEGHIQEERYGARFTEARQAITAHIQAVGEEIIGKPLDEDELDDMDSVEDWKYYDDYRSNAPDFIRGYNMAKSEQRQRLAQYLGKQQDEALHND